MNSRRATSLHLFYGGNTVKLIKRRKLVILRLKNPVKSQLFFTVYKCVDVFMYLRDFSRFFHLKKKKRNYADHVSVYVMLNVIILIQILIRYNIKNLITACTRSLDFDLKIEKSPYPGRGDTPTPLPNPPPARSLRSLAHLSLFHSVPPPPPNTLTHGTPLGAPIY